VPEKEYSDETARLIDEEIRRLVDEAYRDAESMLGAHWDQVIAVAEALLRHETLDADEVDRLMKGQQLAKPSVSELLEAEAEKRKAEERRQRAKAAAEEDPEAPPG